MGRALLFLLPLLSACDQDAPEPPANPRFGHYSTPQTAGLPPAALPGGATTYIPLTPGTNRSADAFSQPAANLAPGLRAEFTIGNSFFSQAWVIAPASVSARDGLGPLFNAAACQDCHLRDGRWHAPAAPGDALVGAVPRLANSIGEADPHYGSQIQTRAVPDLAAEARVSVRWIESTVRLPDGTEFSLRRPDIQLSDWSEESPAAGWRAALRIAPPMIGLGLLEAIPAEDLERHAAKTGARLNRVPDRASAGTTIGRFGWKAAQPNLRQQSLTAFAEDIGITSSLIPRDACTGTQRDCRAQPHGGTPELSARIEQAVVFYAGHLAPVARRDHARPDVIAGEALFREIGCAGCHQPDWMTDESAVSPALADQHIWPYTDLALHDMGPDLADGVEEFEAAGHDWRTPPLWGLGHTHTVSGENAGFLHDGRARSTAEAILWHGGEAQAAREAWSSLPKSQRRQVLRFLASL